MTKKLYDDNSYLSSFDASVISCDKTNDGLFELILNQTAFFPTSGGQYGDKGYIDDAYVSDTVYKDKSEEYIVHIVDKYIEPGKTVHGEIDFKKRYTKMQNHTGEHIISGLIHKKYGYENVGFHLSDSSYFTCDYSGYIDHNELLEFERQVNEIIYKEKVVKTYYPDNIDDLNYRSKKELNGKIRIVEIEDTDMCACCAPHVHNTGEVGIFKILDDMKYKGGVRITCVCGTDAYNDYKARVEIEKEMAVMLNSPVSDIKEALIEEQNTIGKYKAEISNLKDQISNIILQNISTNDSSYIRFFDNYTMDDLRLFSNKVVEKTNGTCMAISSSEKGKLFVLISKNRNLMEIRKEICEKINAKCGGSPNMLTGTIINTDESIINWYNSEFKND